MNSGQIKCQNTSQVYLSGFLLSDMSACMKNEISEHIPANMSDLCRIIETDTPDRMIDYMPSQMQRCKMSQIVQKDGQSQARRLYMPYSEDNADNMSKCVPDGIGEEVAVHVSET